MPEDRTSLKEWALVLLALIGLGALIVPNYGAAMRTEQITKAQMQVSRLRDAIIRYHEQHAAYPEDLTALKPAPVEDLLDPWNQPIRFRHPGIFPVKRGYDPFDVWSAGPDKESGNDDDIGNWGPIRKKLKQDDTQDQ